MGLFGALFQAVFGDTHNPSIFQIPELDRHCAEIQQLVGSEHGMIEAVRGQPHTYQVRNIRFRIDGEKVTKLAP